MPSRLHAAYARLVPRLRKAGEMRGDEPAERARVMAWHTTLDRTLPTGAVLRFDHHYAVVREELAGFPSYVITPRKAAPTRTLFYLHGGGYMAPISGWQVRYAARLAAAIGARVVLPDYPLAPEHSWRDSHHAIAGLAERWAAEEGGIVLAGDSSGGGYALALALTLRDRGGPQPTHLVLHAPWVDLTTSTPETEAYDAVDPWLFIGKVLHVRRVVGRLARGPRPPRGQPGTRRPLRAAARADVLRHPRPAGAGLPAARAACGRGRVGPHSGGARRTDPRLPAPPVPPRGTGGVRRHGEVPGWAGSAMTVRVLAFDDLDAHTAYDVWRLRQQVFVVEQHSPYPDLDGRDREPTTRHLLLERDGELVAYARVLDDGDWSRIGRVLVAPMVRGQGLADELVRTALAEIGDREVRLDAQTGLRDWYASYGFVVTGPAFDEDGVFHVPMTRPRA